MKINKRWIIIFLFPSVALFLLIYALPLLMVLGTSFFDYKLTTVGMHFVGLQNYWRLFHDASFYTALGNTILWIFLQCTLHVGLGVCLALVLYKKPLGWKFVRTTYMIPNIISNAAMGMIFLNIFNPKFGVVNSFLKLIGLPNYQKNWLMDTSTAYTSVSLVWFLFAGYTTTLVLAHILSLDESILEAAKVDGATAWQIDLFVVLPLLKKMIGTTMIMAAAYMLQMFDLIYITTNGGPGKATTNLPLLLYDVYKGQNNYGYANTIGVVIILLGILSLLSINRLFKVNAEEL